jgi:hypothetical protein
VINYDPVILYIYIYIYIYKVYVNTLVDIEQVEILRKLKM